MLGLSNEQMRSCWIIVMIALLGAEILIFSQTFDAYVLILEGETSGWRSVFGQFGKIAKVFVAFLFVVALLLRQELPGSWAKMCARLTWQRAASFTCANLLSYAVLIIVSGKIFGDPQGAASLSSGWYVMWLVIAGATFSFWLLALASSASWLTFFNAHYIKFFVALGIAGLLWAVSSYTTVLWGPMSEYTFLFSALLLDTFAPDILYVDFDEKNLGLGEFIVNVAPACSGYEGVGLVTVFTALYLYVYKHEFRFPRAWLLFPIGAISIWLLNIVRISVLVSIGHFWSPEVAVGGFHSQAGWLSFICTSLALLWLARSWSFFSDTKESSGTRSEAAGLNTPIACLLPLVALLAVVLVSSVLSAGFDWFYPVRVLVVCTCLYFCWRHLSLWPYKITPEAVIAGVVVAVLWGFMLGDNPDADQNFQNGLDQMPLWLTIAWLMFRLIGTALTVPIAEELAFRGYILCKLSRAEVVTRGRIPVSVVALVLSSLAFGALHGAWVAGTMAGLIYGLVRLRSDHIGDAIFAHGLTNALLFVYALATGAWSLL